MHLFKHQWWGAVLIGRLFVNMNSPRLIGYNFWQLFFLFDIGSVACFVCVWSCSERIRNTFLLAWGFKLGPWVHCKSLFGFMNFSFEWHFWSLGMFYSQNWLFFSLFLLIWYAQLPPRPPFLPQLNWFTFSMAAASRERKWSAIHSAVLRYHPRWTDWGWGLVITPSGLSCWNFEIRASGLSTASRGNIIHVTSIRSIFGGAPGYSSCLSKTMIAGRQSPSESFSLHRLYHK